MTYKILKKFQGGQVILALALFFLFVSVSVILGFSLAATKEFRNTHDLNRSLADYYTAESGIEDVAYRLKAGKATASPEELVLNYATTTTTITNIGSDKELVATGDLDDRIRKVKTRLSVSGVGVSFNYGIQVGAGGITMGNGAGINGNVYANGNITGGFITGTAIAANSAALAADQVNDTPSTPLSSVTFATTTTKQDFAQSFQVSTTSPVNKVQMYLKKNGSPSNFTSIRIVADNAGTPSGTTIASAPLGAASVGTSYAWIETAFASNPDLIEGTTYWLVLDAPVGSAANNYTIGANTTYATGTGKVGRYDNTTWINTSPSGLDGYFKIYLGGIMATIDDVDVGSAGVGDAKAHTVTNSTIAGNLYCQVGSSNNKACNTSQPDPSPQPFAVSDANIDQWKSDAVAGGTISGDYTVNSAQSLGPKKITGNLTIQNTLTVTGTLWVEGNISTSNGVTIKLNSGYGASSGIIVVDGTVDLSNNITFQGSGTSGSYIMLLSTSECPNGASCGGSYAMDVSNNVAAVILDAHNGTLHFNNNAGAKEATGRKILLDNNATITYESGLANANFTSGPGGTFTIQSWREVE